jgi:hypothetical protein
VPNGTFAKWHMRQMVLAPNGTYFDHQPSQIRILPALGKTRI